jgi:hypothetical protein
MLGVLPPQNHVRQQGTFHVYTNPRLVPPAALPMLWPGQYPQTNKTRHFHFPGIDTPHTHVRQTQKIMLQQVPHDGTMAVQLSSLPPYVPR